MNFSRNTRAKHLCQDTGRFFGVDPLAEDFATWSPYVYAFNNPVNWRDPDGRSSCCSDVTPPESWQM